MKTLKQVKADEEITILMADKSKCTFVMNLRDYKKQLLEMLTNAKAYKCFNKDATPALRR